MDIHFLLPLAAAALTPDPVIPVLSGIIVLLLASAVSLTFYAYLADRAIFDGLGRVYSVRFGGLDGLLAALLVGFFGLIVLQAVKSGNTETGSEIPGAETIIASMVGVAVLFLLFITGILTALRLRQISWRDTFGLTRISLPGVVWRAALLLLLAFPLIELASDLSQILLAAAGDDDNSSQDLVRFFANSDARGAKWVVALSAMIVAPMQEEFLFRGYIYGVAKRYGGVALGVLFNSALFALIHLHLPSFAPLFVLAVCLSLAYEWTGSLWVPMCMHAMFNSLTVINLLFHGRDF